MDSDVKNALKSLMKKRYLLIGLVLAVGLILFGCTQTEYVCSDGSRVMDFSRCSVCGNNSCDGQETSKTCQIDCTFPHGVPMDNPCRSTIAPILDTNSEIPKCVAGSKGF